MSNVCTLLTKIVKIDILIYNKILEQIMKIWLKFMDTEKMLKNVVYDTHETFEPEHFVDYLHEACYSLDEPTPVVVSKHIKHFLTLNTTTFFPQDFVEKVRFKRLEVEAIPEAKKKDKQA